MPPNTKHFQHTLPANSQPKSRPAKVRKFPKSSGAGPSPLSLTKARHRISGWHVKSEAPPPCAILRASCEEWESMPFAAPHLILRVTNDSASTLRQVSGHDFSRAVKAQKRDSSLRRRPGAPKTRGFRVLGWRSARSISAAQTKKSVTAR